MFADFSNKWTKSTPVQKLPNRQRGELNHHPHHTNVQEKADRDSDYGYSVMPPLTYPDNSIKYEGDNTPRHTLEPHKVLIKIYSSDPISEREPPSEKPDM